MIISKIKKFLETSNHPLIVIGGPTASGKTKLAVKLCKEFDGEIINADSRQIYDEMEIGNERTKPEEMEGIPHHLLAIAKPDEVITIADYKRLAEKVIDDIHSRKKIPFLVGGTGLYLDVVTRNFQIPVGHPDQKLRKKLEQKSVEELLQNLQKIDRKEYEKQKIQKNKRFIIRALEIFQLTGQSKSNTAGQANPKYDSFKIAINWPREILYDRINQRTAYQLEHGMIEEVQTLLKKYDPLLPAMTSIGCKEVIPYLKNEITKEELLGTLRQNNRNYAKRQLTWFKKDPDYHWIEGNAI